MGGDQHLVADTNDQLGGGNTDDSDNSAVEGIDLDHGLVKEEEVVSAG